MKYLTAGILAVVVAFATLRAGSNSGSRSGYEIALVCKSNVPGDYYVQLLSNGHVEDFGVFGAGPNGKEGGKTVSSSPLILGEDVVIKWGVAGKDGLARTNQITFKTAPLVPERTKIRALAFIFYGGKRWEMKAYDGSVGEQGTKEVQPAAPSKGAK